LWVDGEQAQVLELDPAKEASFSLEQQELSGNARQFRARMTAGEHWIAVSILRLYEGLPSNYGGPNPSQRPLPEFKPPPVASPERVEELRKKFEAQRAEKVQTNAARISYLEIGGPYAQAKGPSAKSLKKIYI